MNLYSLRSSPLLSRRAITFKTSWTANGLASVIFFSLAGTALYGAMRGGYESPRVHLPAGLLYYVCVICGGLGIYALWLFRKTFTPSNWLMRVDTGSIVVNLRSYLNAHFSEDDPVVLSFFPSEIESVRKVEEVLTVPTSDRRTAVHRSTYLDLKLSSTNLEAVTRAVRDERERRGSKFLTYPVRLIEGSRLRLTFTGITPTIDEAIKILGPSRTVESELKSEPKDWRELEGKELDDRILDLAERGQVMAAMALVRRKYNYSVTEARKFVEELSDKQ